MTTLSGGVSSNVVNTGSAWAAPTYPTYDYSSLYMSPSYGVGLSYSAPLTGYISSVPRTNSFDMPVQQYYQPLPTVPVSTNTTTNNTPVNVNYSQLSSNSLNTSPIIYPDLQGLSPTQVPNMIQVGNRSYPASAVVAQGVQSFAPGAAPQFDSVNDGAYGYQQTANPQAPTSEPPQTYSLGGGSDTLPDNLAGIPNPYLERPKAPDYYNSAPMQAIQNAPAQAMQALPDPRDFVPQFTPPKNPLMRALWAMPNQARGRAGATAAGIDMWKTASNNAAQIQSTVMPGVVGANREVMQQVGADHRLRESGWNQGAFAGLNFYLDQEEKKTLTKAQALDLAANAFLQPPTVMAPTGQRDPYTGKPVYGQMPNRQKLQMLRQAGQFLGWSESDIYGLASQQDPNTAEQIKQQSLKTQSLAFDLRKSKEMLKYELGQAKTNIDYTKAQIANMRAGTRSQNFATAQQEAVAKYQRWSMIADAMGDVDKMLTNRDTRDARIDGAYLANNKQLAEIFKTQMEAAAIPTETAAKMAAAMASLSNVMNDPETRAIGKGMVDTTYSLVGIPNKPLVSPDPKDPRKTIIQQVPVQTPEAIKAFQQAMPQAPNWTYGRRANTRSGFVQPPAAAPLPANYFDGSQLAGKSNYQPMNNGAPFLNPGAF